MLQFVQSLRINSFARLRFFCQSGRRDAITYIGMNARSLSSVVHVSEFEHDEPLDDLKTIEKDNALRQALSQLSGEFGSLKLDLALGIGGLPKGRIVEIFGREASGKTTLALHVIKEAQKLGGYCAYLDAENAIDPSLLEAMGVDTENLLISHPDSAENLLSVVDTLTKSGSVDVIVVDSVAALVPQCEIDVPVGGVYRDVQSRILTQALRKIHYSLCQSHSVIIFLNQVRSSVKPGQVFGRFDEVTCGGNSLKFYAALRLRMMRTGLLKTGDKITGLGVSVQVVKNKLAPAMKKSDLMIEFGKGFCCEPEVLELACEHGVIVEEGNNYMIEGEVFGDRYSAERHLIENEEVLDNIITNLRKHLFERKRLL
ncbi:DNA repair protein recA homolog 2, mitochondrial isoform X3 [Pistacia vera]|uniref:DNA repair protein recA homolog 2, mitochondrial isoform X3 n=1 Tax=Pistacia vera TaxID=55513 RepID=UPI001263A949|nr:DNA repair protein recA homolog 2, mitochondrial isoform X3 [Pistacia vera]